MKEMIKLRLIGLLGLGGIIIPGLFYYNEYLQTRNKEETISFQEGNFDYRIDFRCYGWGTLGWEKFFPCKRLENITQVVISPQLEGFYPKEEVSSDLRARMDCMGHGCFSSDPEIEDLVWRLYTK